MKYNMSENLNNLEYHVDEPIKKSVVGMALLGFEPIMSCCGFSYKDEKVNKKHLDKAYIYLNHDNILNKNLGTRLVDIAMLSGWNITPLRGSKFVDFYYNKWEENHPWNDKYCPHFYEKALIGIHCLEQAINNYKKFFSEKATIVDGNNFYKENISKFWQYEPTKSWEVTPEIFEKL